MANRRLQGPAVQVWNEGTQQYDWVPQLAWVSPYYQIVDPNWFEVWYWESTDQVWDNGSQQYVNARYWVPYRPGYGQNPPAWTWVSGMDGAVTKGNTRADLLFLARLALDFLGEADNNASGASSPGTGNGGGGAGLLASIQPSTLMDMPLNPGNPFNIGSPTSSAIGQALATQVNAQTAQSIAAQAAAALNAAIANDAGPGLGIGAAASLALGQALGLHSANLNTAVNLAGLAVAMSSFGDVANAAIAQQAADFAFNQAQNALNAAVSISGASDGNTDADGFSGSGGPF